MLHISNLLWPFFIHKTLLLFFYYNSWTCNPLRSWPEVWISYWVWENYYFCVINYGNWSNEKLAIRRLYWPMSLSQLHLLIPPSSITSHHAAKILAGIQIRRETANNKTQTTGADGLLYCPQKCKQLNVSTGGASSFGLRWLWHDNCSHLASQIKSWQTEGEYKDNKKLLKTTVPWLL